MTYSLMVGSIRCHILSDGQQIGDGGGYFGVVPRVLWQRHIEPNREGQIPVAVRSLLIESDAGLILVDTGQGDKLSPKERGFIGLGEKDERLIGELHKAGFSAADIDIVLMTHLHADHIGGNTRWGPDRALVPTFPNAKYICQRLDLAAASFPNERTRATYHVQNWQPLQEQNLLQVVDGPQQLARGVRTAMAPGHTAALQTVWVEDGGESLLFLGDSANWAIHLERLAWVPAYDILPLTTIETKRRLRMEAWASDALLLFQHDPRVVTGRLVTGKRGPMVQPEIVEEAWWDPVVEVQNRNDC